LAPECKDKSGETKNPANDVFQSYVTFLNLENFKTHKPVYI